MYIRNENTATTRLKIPGTDEYAEFNEDGIGRVTAEVGEVLAEEYASIHVDQREDAGAEDDGDDANEHNEDN